MTKTPSTIFWFEKGSKLIDVILRHAYRSVNRIICVVFPNVDVTRTSHVKYPYWYMAQTRKLKQQ